MIRLSLLVLVTWLLAGGAVASGQARIEIRTRGTGVSAADRAGIEQAFRDALRMSRRVKAQMNLIWNQPGGVRARRDRRRAAWAAHPTFPLWFGRDRDIPTMRRLKRRIARLESWLSGARVRVIVQAGGRRACDANTNAFAVIPRRPLKVHLCPRWFGTSPRRRAAILIHELVHQLGFTHPAGTTSRAAALRLATQSSRKARRSPENFEHLHELYF